MATAHSTPPLKEAISSQEDFVWPWVKGNDRGQSIEPLHPAVPEACVHDQLLYELLALTDAIRLGRAREKKLAIEALEKRI